MLFYIDRIYIQTGRKRMEKIKDIIGPIAQLVRAPAS